MNDGGSAFPSPTGNPMQDGGITVRDFFAAKAILGLIPFLQQNSPINEFAIRAYQIADAMLAERAKHE